MAKILKEYGNDKKTREDMADAAKRSLKKGDASTYNNAISSLTKRGSTREEFDDFIKRFESDNEINKQPANNLANENRNSIKLTEQQLKAVIRESVNMILNEIGDKHRFGQGKYGLAMDAASKADALGRKEQAANIRRHGAEDFNQRYGTNDFEMDEYGQLRHTGPDGRQRMYRPNSVMKNLERDGSGRYDKALNNNSYIKGAAQIAKAYPRKKMTSGIKAVDDVDAGIHGNIN